MPRIRRCIAVTIKMAIVSSTDMQVRKTNSISYYNAPKQKRHPSLTEGWTPLSFGTENIHAIVNIVNSIDANFFLNY